jgi:regulator of protease activity HflC (stomatin/prohibitin superfamily)
MIDSALGWVGQVAETLGSLIPTWIHIDCTEAGASVTRGRNVRALTPGIWWYWPFWTIVFHRPGNRQTANLPTQALHTADGNQIVVGGMVRFTIEDPTKALIDTDDVETAITDESLAVICEYVTQQTLDEIQKDRKQVNTAITLKVRSALRPYGVAVERAQLTDFSRCRTLNHVGVALLSTREESE